MEKIVKVLDEVTEMLAMSIRWRADERFPQICDVQQILLEFLIDLNPSFGLAN